MNKEVSVQGQCPLEWPLGWPRTKFPHDNSHFKTTFDRARRKLAEELTRLGAYNVVLSSNVALRRDGQPSGSASPPADRGVAVWFSRVEPVPLMDRRDPTEQRIVLPCDLWMPVEHNVLAIAKHIEAMRGQARWGVGTLERAFTGYSALPPAGHSLPPEDWRKVLAYQENERPSEDSVRDRFRSLASKAHPDAAGGTSSAFLRIVRARDEALVALGYRKK